MLSGTIALGTMLLIWCGSGLITALIFHLKGRNVIGGFLLGLVFGWIGVIIALFWPKA